MPPALKFRSEPWLQSPLRTPVGEIELAGLLRNVPGIDPTGMRILRHFTLVLMVDGKGYYRDARGTKLELAPGDVVLVFPEIAHAYGPLPGHEWTQIYFVFDGPQFQLWRAHHVKTVERIIGMKPGTGGTSGVNYLMKALELKFFPELWQVRASM